MDASFIAEPSLICLMANGGLIIAALHLSLAFKGTQKQGLIQRDTEVEGELRLQ